MPFPFRRISAHTYGGRTVAQVGIHRDPEQLLTTLRELRRKMDLSIEMSVVRRGSSLTMLIHPRRAPVALRFCWAH